VIKLLSPVFFLLICFYNSAAQDKIKYFKSVHIEYLNNENKDNYIFSKTETPSIFHFSFHNNKNEKVSFHFKSKHKKIFAEQIENHLKRKDIITHGKYSLISPEQYIIDGQYNNGVPSGRWTEKTLDGIIKKEIYYSNTNEIIYATKKFYSPRGKIQMSSNYKNGIKDGEEKLYHTNGQALSICHYLNGKKQGYKAYYDINNKLISNELYEEDELSIRKERLQLLLNQLEGGEKTPGFVGGYNSLLEALQQKLLTKEITTNDNDIIDLSLLINSQGKIDSIYTNNKVLKDSLIEKVFDNTIDIGINEVCDAKFPYYLDLKIYISDVINKVEQPLFLTPKDFRYNNKYGWVQTFSYSWKKFDILDLSMAQPPVFPGGESALAFYISYSVKYPEDAIKHNIEGTINVSFVIEYDGSITNVKNINSVHPSIDKEAVRVVQKMPNWSPGKDENGNAYRTCMTIPIHFVLR